MAKQQPSKDCSFPGCSYKIKTSSGVSGAYMHLMSHYQRTTYKTRDDICRNSNPEHICIDANMFCVRETAARLMQGNVTQGGQQQVPATGGPTSMTSNTGPCSYHGTVTSRTPPPSSCSPTADPLQADTASTGNPPTVTKTKFFTNVVRSLAGQRQKQQRSPATGAPAANAAQWWEQESYTKQHNRVQQRFAAEAHEARIALDTAAQAMQREPQQTPRPTKKEPQLTP